MGIVGFLVFSQCIRIEKHLRFGAGRKQRYWTYNLPRQFFSFQITAADQSRQMQDQMSGAAMAMPPDPKVAFKAEWEALEIVDHQWALADIESKLIGEEKVKTE